MYLTCRKLTPFARNAQNLVVEPESYRGLSFRKTWIKNTEKIFKISQNINCSRTVTNLSEVDTICLKFVKVKSLIEGNIFKKLG